ncbi:MAG: Stp1/IreP family PP2C-type Ser/Thr phosphatase [Acidobacteria bacterium]|nr:Stp1/IreP family PP2C-type Ser/Thr phosphatase [Acidobacteriota bacterium]
MRQGNEDNFLILDLATSNSWAGIAHEATEIQTIQLGSQGAVFAVSDGMGGALAGEVASRMAVEIVRDLIPRLRTQEEYRQLTLQEQLRVAIEQANAAIHIESIVNAECRGMGATFTAVALADDHACFAQVGDSRAHLIRQGQITRITKDQSVVQQLIDLGQITEEQAATHPRRNYILQALGATNEIDVVVSYLPLRAGDLLLLCSDGLSGKMSNEEMAQIVTEAEDFKEACDKLIALANERGGEDNITVLLVKVAGEALAAPEDETVAPEFVPRPSTSPTEYLLEDVGLPPPVPAGDNDNLSSGQTIASDFPPSPAAIEQFSPLVPAIEPSQPRTESEKRGLDGRKLVIICVIVALLLSATAFYLNYRAKH